MGSPDRRSAPDLTAHRAAAVLAVGQWLAVGTVVSGFVVGWIFPDLLPGVGHRLHRAGTVIVTGTSLVGLLAVGLGCSDRRLSRYAFAALAMAVLGALLAR